MILRLILLINFLALGPSLGPKVEAEAPEPACTSTVTGTLEVIPEVKLTVEQGAHHQPKYWA